MTLSFLDLAVMGHLKPLRIDSRLHPVSSQYLYAARKYVELFQAVDVVAPTRKLEVWSELKMEQ